MPPGRVFLKFWLPNERLGEGGSSSCIFEDSTVRLLDERKEKQNETEGINKNEKQKTKNEKRKTKAKARETQQK